MKSLAITLFTAVAVIGIALACDLFASPNSASKEPLVGKTIVTRDDYGRVVKELTLFVDGQDWQETAMRQISYSDGQSESVSYKKVNGQWVPDSKVVTETANGVPVCYSYYSAAQNGDWQVVAQQKTDDLACNDVVDDLVFDVDGNLVMKATYVYGNEGKVGLTKEEYGYDSDSHKTRVQYAWSGDSWHKILSSKLVAE